MVSKRKNFAAPPAALVSTGLASAEGEAAIVDLGDDPFRDSIDMTHLLGRGIDEWVLATVGQLRAFVAGGTQTRASVATYGRQGMPTFFDFLLGTGASCTPKTLDRRHVEQFIAWLKAKSDWTDITRRNRYTHWKSVMLGLRRRKLVAADPAMFPRAPFPKPCGGQRGEQSLSPGERARLAEAIRLDIIALHQGTFVGNDRDGLTVYVLALAMRTGTNTTPMLELRRDCLGPHPFMPNMRLIRCFKRRGNSTSIKAIRATRVDESPMSVPMDGVALLDKVLERTQALLPEAPARARDRVWLYRVDQRARHHAGEVVTLNDNSLELGIATLVDRHGLVADDGKRLRLNMSRLRKTMENRLWRLSNGDLLTVSLIMGHDPKVAEQSYLQVTADMRRNATIVGEALPDMYRAGPTAQSRGKVIPIPLEKTPVGSCKDSLFGDMAPKDGTNHCADFISCFSCRSYALVGSPKDLHRLFSFYWFLAAERTRIVSRQWADHYAWVLAQIDSFTLSNFDQRIIEDAKALARVAPHKFWKNYQMQAEAQQNANGN